MKLKLFTNRTSLRMWSGKIFLVMRITLFLLLFSITQLFAVDSYSQNARINLNSANKSVKEVLADIQNQSEFFFMFNSKIIDVERKVDIQAENEKINDVLSKIFNGTDVAYTVVERQIVLFSTKSLAEQQQGKKLSGKVTDPSGIALPGVSVVVKGTTTGVITDLNGNYSLSVPANAQILVFSFVGMNTKEVKIGNQSTIDVELSETTIALEEVVAVGYGTQKKVNMTGSVATVASGDIVKRTVTNTITTLEGKVAGLKINQGSGMPGREGVSFQIRGASSWGTDSTPLVLIDGVVGSLDRISSTDIESVSVLKDAASSSIYGARAANGVILVTTKQGKAGKPVLTYNLTMGSSSATDTPNQIWNSKQYMDLFNKAVSRGTIAASAYPQGVIDLYSNPNRDMNAYPDYNWQDAVWRNALLQQHNIGISGGTENIKYNISAGFLDQDGALRWHGYKRYNGLANVSATVNKYLTVGTNISYNYSKSASPYYENANFMLMVMTQSPMDKPYINDGSGHYTDRVIPTGLGGTNNNRNPFWIGNETYRNNYDWQANIQGWFDINFLQGKDMKLKWSNKYAFNYGDYFQQIYHYSADHYYYLKEKDYKAGGADAYIQSGENFGPEALTNTNNTTRNLLSTFYSTLNWNWTIDQHDISVMAGYSQETQNSRYLNGNRIVFPIKAMYEIDGMGSLGQNVNGGSSQWAFQSLFGRGTYAFRSKYLLEANVRYDGTSRIIKDTRWGFFPSGSAAWRISEEGFIKDNLTWISSLKIRASYGLLGNANIGNYPYQDVYSGTSYAFNQNQEQAVIQAGLKNKELAWEKTKVTNIGLDFNIKNSIFYGTVDVYNKYTTGILAGASMPNSTGMSAPTINYGEFKNYGIELELGHSNKIGEFTYDIHGVMSINKNEVMKYPAPAYGTRVIEEGNPYNDYYLYECIGLFKSQAELNAVATPGSPKIGDIKFKDQNGDGKITGADRVRVQGAYPKFIYSFGINLSWRNFDLTSFLQGVSGQKYLISGWGWDPFTQNSSPNPMFLNAYDPVDNPNSNIPAIYASGYAPMTGGTAAGSTYRLQNASYLRLKNLQIGYNVPPSVLQKLGIGQLRVFVGGDNLLTWTPYFDGDPERAGDGTWCTYPQTKTLTAGINVKF
jgi:TonB-linked SusC/RagA family outer membrane protein